MAGRSQAWIIYLELVEWRYLDYTAYQKADKSCVGYSWLSLEKGWGWKELHRVIIEVIKAVDSKT